MSLKKLFITVSTQNPNCPDNCFEIYEPVCGSDGNSYSNECELKSQRCKHGPSDLVIVDYSGKCTGKLNTIPI